MDRILVPGLPLRAHVGITAAERAAAQDLELHLDLRLDLRRAGERDDFAHTIDYDAVSARVAEVVTSREFHLIESVAEACARELLAAYPRVDVVRVEVRKPGALRVHGVPYAAVEVTRGRG